MEETSSSTDDGAPNTLRSKLKKFSKRRSNEGIPRKKPTVTISEPLGVEAVYNYPVLDDLVFEKAGEEATDPPKGQRAPASNASMKRLVHKSASVLDVELKNVLINDSLATVRTRSQSSKKIQRRKLDLLELARGEAEVIEIMTRLAEDASDPEDEPTCCPTRRAKEKAAIENFGESEEEEGYRVTKDDILMSRTQRTIKWLVCAVATIDFFMSAQDTYTILIRKMQIEYLFMAQIYNCDALMSPGDNWLVFANMIHAIVSVGLLFMEDRSTAAFGIYWLISQTARSFFMVLEAFFKSRFKKHFVLVLLSYLWWRLPLDILQMGVVMFRYYKLNNPFPQRLKDLATEIHLDRPLNNELRLRDSTFLQSKFRLREAAAFQTLEIIRKVKKMGKDKKQTRFEIIRSEIAKAFSVLTNPKRYPMKQTTAQAKVKKEKFDDADKATIFPPDSKENTKLGKVESDASGGGDASKENLRTTRK